MDNSNEAWMTNKFFAAVLNIAESRISEFTASVATQKGDNYASVMYRVKVTLHDQNARSLIVKVTPSGEIRSKVMEKNLLYPREIIMYTKVLVEVQKLLNSISDGAKISPECIFTTESPTKMLVFEDLKDAGYVMKDRKQFLDRNDTLHVLSKLAKLHACSVIIYAKHPTMMDIFEEGSVSTNPDRQDFLIFYTLMAKMLKAAADHIGGFEALADKLEKFPSKIIAKGVELYTRDESGFNVLCHNDIWTNNLMFRYSDNGHVDDILFLDYQLSCMGSPGLDLNYLLWSSVQSEYLKSDFKFFIKHYHEILVDTLKKLKYGGRIPTVQDIHIEMIKTGFQAIYATICLRPLAFMESSESAEMDIFLKDSPEGHAFRESVFFNPKYIEFITPLITEFNLMGYFD